MRRASIVALVALAACLVARARGDEPPAWDPGSTWVFSASVVSWKDPALAPFTSTRLDDVLVGTWKKRGVAEDRLVYLRDEKATLEAMRRELRALAGRAGAGSTLVVSFQGHGLREKGRTILACHDVDTKHADRTGFAVDEIAPLLDGWKGERLILLGDCCHSGALGSVVAEVERKRPGVRAAAFTSATASNRSTSHWTFTEALIGALSGEGVVDRNRDGRISFKEVDEFVHDEMKFAEGQLAHATRGRAFEEELVLARVEAGRALVAKAEGPWRVGDYVEAKDKEGTWYGARVIDVKEGASRVHFPGWDAEWDEWVASDRLRKIERKPLRVGERYEVEWEHKDWYVASVLDSAEGFFWFVHYASELGEDDEWVTSDRVRELPPGKGRPEFAPLAPRAPVVGDVVAARWKRGWWLAKVTAIEKPLHRIAYSDGTEGAALQDELIPVAAEKEIAAGDRVLACWKDDDAQMYPGKVVEKRAGAVVVAWDDGSTPSPAPVGRVARVKAAAK